MAARDNTALHAALIIMVLLTVTLAITTYLFFGWSEEAKKTEKDAKDRLATAQNELRSMKSEQRIQKFIVGWDDTLTLADVEGEIAALGEQNGAAKQIFQAFKADMAKYGEGLPDPNYRKLPEHLLAALKTKNDSLAAALTSLRNLEAENKNVVSKESERANLFLKNAQKAADDLAATISAFDKERTGWNGEKDTLKKQIADLGTQVNQAKADSQKEIKLANETVARVRKEFDLVQAQLDKYREHENFEIPDGKIASVHQKTNIVIINLGSADGLRKQVSFSVYDQSENSATKAQKKAGIEITRIIDEHSAEGRIVFSSNTNPILPGDLIYSPVWQSGSKLHFALAPWLDIDGDGLNDREMIRGLIERNSGVVDEANEMSINTRYLVDITELPARELADETIEKLRGVRNAMRTQAQDMRIRIIHVNEVLDWMGHKQQDRTYHLGITGSTERKNNKSRPGAEGDPASRELPRRDPPRAPR